MARKSKLRRARELLEAEILRTMQEITKAAPREHKLLGSHMEALAETAMDIIKARGGLRLAETFMPDLHQVVRMQVGTVDALYKRLAIQVAALKVLQEADRSPGPVLSETARRIISNLLDNKPIVLTPHEQKMYLPTPEVRNVHRKE